MYSRVYDSDRPIRMVIRQNAKRNANYSRSPTITSISPGRSVIAPMTLYYPSHHPHAEKDYQRTKYRPDS